MNKTIICTTIVLLSLLMSFPSAANNNHSIYLVRHAEKQSSKNDPALTQCGQLRAIQLANMLSKANIKNVYSTSYKRTMATAQPIAEKQNIAIKSYAPNKLEQLTREIIQLKENVLVVGHSNTTPRLAQLLSGQDVKALSEQEYQELYQIQIVGETQVLTILKQPLRCE